MYALDGVPLQNSTYGWRFKRSSEPKVARSVDRADFNASNRDGTTVVRGHLATPTLPLTVSSPGTNLERLVLLMSLGTSLTLASDPSASLYVQAVTVTTVTVSAAGDGLYEVTAVYRAPQVWWRDAAPTTWTSAGLATTSSPGAVSLAILPATTGWVTDAQVLITGGFDTPRVAGKNSTWMQYSTTIYGQWVRFDATKGKAYFGTIGDGADPWTGGSDATSHLDTGAYPYFLELGPSSTGPGCSLTLSYNRVTWANSTVAVRASNAYRR